MADGELFYYHRRMLARLIALAALMLTGCLAGEKVRRGSDLREPDEAKRTFASCPGADALATATDVSWAPQTSRLAEHRALRTRMKIPLPEGTSRILFWSSGTHHTSFDFSVIAVRDAQGRWRTSGIGEQGPGLPSIAPRPPLTLERDLSVDEGRALDRALADPCLYASPTYQRNPGIVAGSAVQTMEIETPQRRWTGSWVGIRTPQQASVVNLITE